ncbi:hypothetical protein HOY82DRAFT_582414 [Tuber indicum]|nr:hypothetical protein HOY82DRAFT_582414 [Tuber indicum]
MALNRSRIRNVYFHDATNPDVTLGGFFQNGSITEAKFLDMLGILLIIEGNPPRVQERVSGDILSRTDIPLKRGIYDIYCDGMCCISPIYWAPRFLISPASIQVNNEPWIPRRFCHGVRSRDRRCVISGLINPEAHIQANNWLGFQVAHIFPPEHENLRTQCDYGREITDTDNTLEALKIDSYGRILDPICHNPDDPHRASDQPLRWYFRQSILANARGAGEPIFEHDFPPGRDMAGEILAGPHGHFIFALEIASRLRRFPKDNRFRHREILQLSGQGH